MARENQPTPAGLAHHYTHIAISLHESRKGTKTNTASGKQTAEALDKTIQGVLALIDAFVAQEHRDIPVTKAS